MSKSDFDDELVLVEARTFVDRAEEINRKIKTVRAKQNAYHFLLTFIAFLCIGTAGFLLCNALVDLDKQFQLEARV